MYYFGWFCGVFCWKIFGVSVTESVDPEWVDTDFNAVKPWLPWGRVLPREQHLGFCFVSTSSLGNIKNYQQQKNLFLCTQCPWEFWSLLLLSLKSWVTQIPSCLWDCPPSVADHRLLLLGAQLGCCSPCLPMNYALHGVVFSLLIRTKSREIWLNQFILLCCLPSSFTCLSLWDGCPALTVTARQPVRMFRVGLVCSPPEQFSFLYLLFFFSVLCIVSLNLK